MAFEIKITASTADELVSAIDAFHDAIAGRKPSEAKTDTGNEKPKTTRRKASTDSAPADGAASEQSSPNASTLEPADEGNDAAAVEEPAASTSTAASLSDTAGPSRDEVLTIAVKFSQTHGDAALEEAMKARGVERFSQLAESDWPAFVKWMADYKPSALS